jgi:hypothetical protein
MLEIDGVAEGEELGSNVLLWPLYRAVSLLQPEGVLWGPPARALIAGRVRLLREALA